VLLLKPTTNLLFVLVVLLTVGLGEALGGDAPAAPTTTNIIRIGIRKAKRP
jgi:hypothetical protein